MNPLLAAAYAGCFGLSLALALALTPLCRNLARRVGLVDKPGVRKIHEKVTPYGGGIAMASAVGLTMLAMLAALADPWGLMAGWRAELWPYLGVPRGESVTRLAGLVLGAGGMVALGLADDRRPLGPRVKLAAQVAAALAVFATGTRVTLFVQSDVASCVFTVLWIVLITNAMNLLDNMDGLCAGVAAIAASIFFVIALQTEQTMLACALAALVGGALGFLRFNFAPASVFMGDSGSLFLGFMLGALSVCGTYGDDPRYTLSVAIPLVTLAIPLFDTCSVMLIRWRNGKPFFVGDTNHFSHRLVRLGMTRRVAVLTIYVLSLALGLLATILSRLQGIDGLLALLHTFGILVVIGLLEYAAARRDHDRTDTPGQ